MKSWLIIRSYPEEMGKVAFLDNISARRQHTSIKWVIFVLIFHPLLKSMDEIINKNFNLLYIER